MSPVLRTGRGSGCTGRLFGTKGAGAMAAPIAAPPSPPFIFVESGTATPHRLEWHHRCCHIGTGTVEIRYMETPMIERTGSAMWVALAIAGFVVCAAGAADAGVRVKQKLHPTSFAPKARGNAKLSLKSDAKGAFSIVARRLAAGADYDVVVGGIKVGAITTNGHGAGKVAFGTTKRHKRGILGFDPRGRSVAVRDHDG